MVNNSSVNSIDYLGLNPWGAAFGIPEDYARQQHLLQDMPPIPDNSFHTGRNMKNKCPQKIPGFDSQCPNKDSREAAI